jgi:hypothetical protein
MIDLWDAGTEVNQEPGVGEDQAPRQSGPDTGADENGTVENIMDVNDGYAYPPDEEIIQLELTHDGGTMFTLTITNVSGNSNLPSPIAPGVWVIHSDGNPLFTSGESASEGLEDLAEDGDNSILDTELTENSGYVSPFAPGAFAVFTGNNPLFTSGGNASSGLESMAEDGDPSGLASELASIENVFMSGAFNIPVGAGAPGPLFPGEQYEFTLTAEEGERLNFTTMLVQTNDLFIAATSDGIELFSNGIPLSGDITSQLSLWDAGTEVNEYPGAGNYQAPRQPGADEGEDESGSVMPIGDSFEYPSIGEMIKVTITAN